MLPQHLAIVMDGNGRWARARGLSRLDGHRAGVDSATDIIRYCGELGIRYLTLYAFSSENWKRPASEITGIMDLLREYLSRDSHELVENGVHVRTIGNLDRLPFTLRTALHSVCDKTKHGNKLTVTIALSYGSRDEITNATRNIVTDILSGKLGLDQITEEKFASYLQTSGIPDPDLLIRTSGEKRLSNFLLWQLSYTELYMTDTLWPDFDRTCLDMALADYAKRERRFGDAA